MKDVESMQGLEPLLSVDDLAILLNRSPKSVKQDASRKPLSLPPRVVMPGCRKLAWRPSTVRAWLDQLEKAEVARREEQQRRLQPLNLAQLTAQTVAARRGGRR